ncbi:MAG: thioredoxin domain-containing protein [Candidatus Binatia bacterium]|nr:thioredoxin domain-containing protein [Candidatus Binatia bacterium]
MKRSFVVLAAAGGLLLAFVAATQLYTSLEADRIETLATGADSPLERPHSRKKGPADAKVVLVEFFDPACETCRDFDPYVKTLLAEHPNRVRLVLRYAPFHQGSDSVVKALEAAGLQDRYWETLQVLYETQPQWASHHHPQPEKIWQFLPSAGVDVDRARRDAQDPRFAQIIEQDLADLKTLGVRKTPQFFVNGKPLTRFGYEQLKSLVEAEIAAQYPQ